MNERREGEGLSTADMASAAEHGGRAPGGEPKYGERDEARAEPRAAGATVAAGGEKAGPDAAPLFSASEAQDFRSQWDAIQAGFVDDPRRAVEQADSLVAETMKRLAEVFADERANLERQWDSGDNVSTEDLRVALQRYRSFFDRLLSL